MTLGEFLSALFEHGQVRVGAAGEQPTADEWARADAVLAEWEVANRLEFPGTPPEYAPDAARWAAGRFYRACQLLVDREASPESITAAVGVACPPAAVATRHYSVDLVFRFLPDLLRHASRLAQADPLCEQLREWGRAWPLSSVGMPGIEGVDAGDILQHPGLLALYVDRIVARDDASRLADPRVRAAVRAAVGGYPELAAGLAAALAADGEREPS